MGKISTSISNIVYAIKNQWKWAKQRVIFSIAKIPVTVMLSLISAYFPSILISSIQDENSYLVILKVIVIYFLLWLLLQIIESFRFSRVEMHRFLVSNMYQLKMTEKHLSTDYANTENPNVLQKYSIAMRDSWGACAPDEILQSVISLAVNFTGLVTYGVIIASVSPMFIITILVSTSVIFLYGKYKIKYAESHRKLWNTYERKLGYLINVERNPEYAKDIRVFNMAKWLDSLYVNQMNGRISESNKQRNIDFIGSVISASLIFIQNAIVYYVLVRKLLMGNIDVANFMFTLTIVTGFSAWLTSIIGNWNTISAQAIMIGRYREYFNIVDYFNHGEGAEPPSKTDYPLSISFKNVSFRYPGSDHFIINNLSFEVGKGEHIAIVGENGAGKTTIVKLLCGMYLPTDGNVFINDISSDEYNINDYYSLFSTVFQDIYLLPITIKEFITTVDDVVNTEKMWDSIKKSGLFEKINSLEHGVDTRLMRGVYDDGLELSGGEKQKLMLARALYKDAPIVVLDEPTAALDPIAESNLYENFNILTKDKTTIYISHRLSSTKFCDRIFYLENGKIIENGSHEELMKKNGAYKNLFMIQSQYYQKTG